MKGFFSSFFGLLCWGTTLAPSQSWALKTNFLEPHRGLSLGTGTYLRSLYSGNVFDPVPFMAGTGNTITGSEDYYLLPIKIGYFKELGPLSVEAYFNYTINTLATWDSTGTNAGSGQTLFRSYGLGGNLGIAVSTAERFRLLLIFNAEYIYEIARVSFTPTGGSAATAILRSPATIFGAGLQPELWLGDMWVLTTFVGFQGAVSGSWTVTQAGDILGTAFQTGALTDPATSTAVAAQFGGLLVGVGLKLNFQ